MSKYAYIPLSDAANFLAGSPEVPIYTASHIAGVQPCLADSNGEPMPNVLLMEAADFSPELRELILEVYDGQVFEDATAYQVYVQDMLEAQMNQDD